MGKHNLKYDDEYEFETDELIRQGAREARNTRERESRINGKVRDLDRKKGRKEKREERRW